MRKIVPYGNHKFKIFVQRSDIKRLVELNIPIPSSIFTKIVKELECITEENKNSFIEFTDSDEMIFFVEQDWILDYNVYKDFSLVELDIAKRIFLEEIWSLEKELNNIPSENQELRKKISQQIQKEAMSLESLIDFIETKKGELFSLKGPKKS